MRTFTKDMFRKEEQTPVTCGGVSPCVQSPNVKTFKDPGIDSTESFPCENRIDFREGGGGGHENEDDSN